jgi:hypothetical protein
MDYGELEEAKEILKGLDQKEAVELGLHLGILH